MEGGKERDPPRPDSRHGRFVTVLTQSSYYDPRLTCLFLTAVRVDFVSFLFFLPT